MVVVLLLHKVHQIHVWWFVHNLLSQIEYLAEMLHGSHHPRFSTWPATLVRIFPLRLFVDSGKQLLDSLRLELYIDFAIKSSGDPCTNFIQPMYMAYTLWLHSSMLLVCDPSSFAVGAFHEVIFLVSHHCLNKCFYFLVSSFEHFNNIWLYGLVLPMIPLSIATAMGLGVVTLRSSMPLSSLVPKLISLSKPSGTWRSPSNQGNANAAIIINSRHFQIVLLAPGTGPRREVHQTNNKRSQIWECSWTSQVWWWWCNCHIPPGVTCWESAFNPNQNFLVVDLEWS